MHVICVKWNFLHCKLRYLIAVLVSSSAVASGEHEHPASPGTPTAAGCTCFYSEFFMLTILIVLYYYRFISTVPYDTGKYSFDFFFFFKFKW